MRQGLGRASVAVMAVVVGSTSGACGVLRADEPAAPTALATLSPDVPVTPHAPPTTPPPGSRPLVYAFPFVGQVVSYQHEHDEFPASDVFGCGATIVSPIWGTVGETRTVDPWDPEVDDPATRAGLYVTILGGDGVRYFFANLASVSVNPGDAVDAGTPIGVMGQTGVARDSACLTHVGISRQCPSPEVGVRRGEVWPWVFLDAWRSGNLELTPGLDVYGAIGENPTACEDAAVTAGLSEV